jgi:hypothetical protein
MNIPDNWYLKGSYELGDYFLEIGIYDKSADNFNRNLLHESLNALGGTDTIGFYFLTDNKWNYTQQLPEDSNQITFNQFEEFILNKTKPVEKDYQYLIKFLNNI